MEKQKWYLIDRKKIIIGIGSQKKIYLSVVMFNRSLLIDIFPKISLLRWYSVQ